MNPVSTVDADYVRINYELGGRVFTRWASAITVDGDGFVGFVDVETGQKKYLSSSTSYAITEVNAEDLPPGVKKIEEQAAKQ